MSHVYMKVSYYVIDFSPAARAEEEFCASMDDHCANCVTSSRCDRCRDGKCRVASTCREYSQVQMRAKLSFKYSRLMSILLGMKYVLDSRYSWW